MSQRMEPSVLLARFRAGERVDVGRLIFEAVLQPARVRWAGRVLRSCMRAHGEVVPGEVEAVLALTSDPSRWGEGHDAFDSLRHRTLEAERGQHPPLLKALFYVAEVVAKVTYNASGRSAPFDADSGWWLAPNAINFTDRLPRLIVKGQATILIEMRFNISTPNIVRFTAGSVAWTKR